MLSTFVVTLFQRTRHSISTPHYPILEAPPPQIQNQLALVQNKRHLPETRSSIRDRDKKDERPNQRRNVPKVQIPESTNERPSPKFSNLYGVIDTNKLRLLKSKM